MLRFWGDGSQESMDLVNAIRVRSTENFNWTFIFILAVVFYVYGVLWLYEILQCRHRESRRISSVVRKK